MTSFRNDNGDGVRARRAVPLQGSSYAEGERRRSIRLKGNDYSRAGGYFITICTRNRECLLGDIVDDQVRLNCSGRIVCEEWLRSADLRAYVTIDQFVVMPNHIHGVILLQERDCRGTARRALSARETKCDVVAITTNGGQIIERFGRPTEGSIPTIIRAFKSATTKRIHERGKTPGSPV